MTRIQSAPVTRLGRRSFVASMGALIAVAAVGCGGDTDKQSDALLGALEANDYAKLKAVSNPALLDELTEDKFAHTAAIYSMLGSKKKKQRTAIAAKNASSAADYEVEYDLGTVELRMSLSGDRLDAVELKGNGWEAAWAALAKDRTTKCLDAMEKGDLVAVEEFSSEQFKKSTEGKTPPSFTELGKRKSVEPGVKPTSFVVTYENGVLDAEVFIVAGKINGFTLESRRPPKAE